MDDVFISHRSWELTTLQTGDTLKKDVPKGPPECLVVAEDVRVGSFQLDHSVLSRLHRQEKEF